MTDNTLTDSELDLLERLPGPPLIAEFHTTNVWIAEWLSPNERKTGKLLHDWLQERRPGWSAYSACKGKADVFSFIERAAIHAEQFKMVPVLHIEAHGDENGLAPDRIGSALLGWDELTAPLQRLNLATGCNLVVFVGACTGFAAIKTFSRGPRAPAAALVGPDDNLNENDLLRGAKEFYRSWMSGCSKLDDIAESASREMEPVVLEPEPFALLAFEAMAEWLIKSVRPDEQHRRKEGMRRRLQGLNKFTRTEIEQRLLLYSPIPPTSHVQQKWDTLFMMDLYPENRERFGVDMAAVLEMIVRDREGKDT